MKFVLIGNGVMGSAILKRAIAAGVLRRSQCTVVTRAMDPVSVCRNADVVLIAVKPQDARAVFDTLRGTLRSTTLVISIMAGVSLRIMQRTLMHSRIIRAMPNTPAQIGKGMTVWVGGRAISRAHYFFAQKLFRALGKELRVHDEHLLDAATAVSGSGPAYVFAFAEALIAAAQKLGFTKKDATLLVRETLSGGVALWEKSGMDVTTLRKRVTSKNGTTAAALAVLQQQRFSKTIVRALAAARRRAEEIARTLDKSVKMF